MTKSLKHPGPLVEVVHKKSFHKGWKPDRMGTVLFGVLFSTWHHCPDVLEESGNDFLGCDMGSMVDPSDSITRLSLED